MGLARARLATTRSVSVRSRLPTMAYNTSGWTPAVSTSQAVLSFRRLSTQCFAGTKMRPNAMSVYRMFQQGSGKQAIGSLSILGNRLFGQVDSLPGVGLFKSFLRQVQLNSSLKKKTV